MVIHYNTVLDDIWLKFVSTLPFFRRGAGQLENNLLKLKTFQVHQPLNTPKDTFDRVFGFQKQLFLGMEE